MSIVYLIFLYSFVFSQDSLSVLHVSSEPSGAQIFIDDVLSGSTPHTITRISTGTHILKLIRDDYEEWVTVIDIILSDTTKVHAILNEKSGQIQVRTDVPNVPIFLDKRSVGRSPILIKNVSIGTHVIEARNPHYKVGQQERAVVRDTVQITNEGVKIVDLLVEKCWITINSNPIESEIEISEEFYGFLPIHEKELKAGIYNLDVSKEGFESEHLIINLDPGEYREINVHLTPMTYNKIFYRSLIFPGIGQIYADKKVKGYLFTFSEIAAIGGAIYMNNKLSDESKIYTDLYNQYQNSLNEEEVIRLHDAVEDSYNKVQQYETYRNVLIGAAIAIWLGNIYDAYLLGKEVEEKNNSVLTFLSKSQFYVQANEKNYSIGMNISF
jgi:hypothetical protein